MAVPVPKPRPAPTPSPLVIVPVAGDPEKRRKAMEALGRLLERLGCV